MKNTASIILLIIGCIAGVAVCLLFTNDKKQDAGDPVTITNTADVKQTIRSDEKLTTVIDSLKQKTLLVDKQLKNTKLALNKSEHSNTILQKQLYDLIKVNNADTAKQLTACDSLKAKLVMLMQNDDVKDSLHNIISNYWEEKDQNKDSIIQTQQLQYRIMKSAWNKSLDQQQSLSTQNRLMERQIKKQKTKSKLVGAGLLLIAGFTTHYLLTH